MKGENERIKHYYKIESLSFYNYEEIMEVFCRILRDFSIDELAEKKIFIDDVEYNCKIYELIDKSKFENFTQYISLIDTADMDKDDCTLEASIKMPEVDKNYIVVSYRLEGKKRQNIELKFDEKVYNEEQFDDGKMDDEEIDFIISIIGDPMLKEIMEEQRERRKQI